MKPNELYTLLDNAGADYEVVEVFEGLRVINVVVDETVGLGKLWYCKGYWNDDHKPMTFLVCDGEWDGIDDGADERISLYTEGQPVVADHGDYTITEAEPYEPDWWENKVAGVHTS